MLKMGAWLLHQIGDKAPPAARYSSEATCELNRRCYPCAADIVDVLSSSLSLSGGLSIQDKTWMLPGPCHRRAHIGAGINKRVRG